MQEAIQILRVAKSILGMGSLLYHGTDKEAAGRQILSDKALKPGSELVKKSNGFLTPVTGRVYLSQNLRYSIIYVLGGDILGGELPPTWSKHDKYGYLFVVDPNDIREPQPDEDDIGRLIGEGLNGEKCPSWLLDMGKMGLTLRQLQKVKGGEYIYFAQAGKKLVKRMSQEQKRDLIDNWGANVANEGEIQIRQAWKFNKEKCPQLSRDGSNFFQLAERVM